MDTIRKTSLVAVVALLATLAWQGPASAATPTCRGLVPTIMGTAGDDTITGTPGADVIMGRFGNDTIDGGGGDDVICGGPGEDKISGGEGNDSSNGGPQRAGIEGRAG